MKRLQFAALLLSAWTLITLVACSEDPTGGGSGGINPPVNPQPTEDVVEATFSGLVVNLANTPTGALPYISKRLSNTTTTLSDEADVVIIDEACAQRLLQNEADFILIKRLWDYKKAILFLDPGAQAIALKQALNGHSTLEGSHLEQQLSLFDQMCVYITRADGSSLYHEKADKESETVTGIIGSINENGERIEETPIEMTYAVPAPTEYHKGRVGENVARWLNKHALVGEQSHSSFRTRSEEYMTTPVIRTWEVSRTITYDWPKTECGQSGNFPDPRTVTARIEMVIYGGYWEAGDADVYDVNIYEEFPANQTYIQNYYYREKGAYNYKLTDGCYYGPRVRLSFDQSTGDYPLEDIQLEQVAPLPQGGTYSTIHAPAATSFGSSLAVTASYPPGITGGFSCGISLPQTNITFNHSDMRMDFDNTNKEALWTYSTDYSAYQSYVGFNADFIGVPEIVRSFCHTDQAVSFLLQNSRKYEKQTIYFDVLVGRTVYGEFAEPWDHRWCTREHSTHWWSIGLPKVNRYFAQYTPYPFPGYSTADSPGWSFLEKSLMDNINYAALCNDDLWVAAQVEGELDPTAEGIWADVIETLKTQYNGTDTDGEYLIALARPDGTHLNLGLHIKEGKWSQAKYENGTWVDVE